MRYARLFNWFLLLCTVSYIACMVVYTMIINQDFRGSRWLNVFLGVVLVAASFAFLATIFTEPGYLPRRYELEAISKNQGMGNVRKKHLQAIDELYWTYFNDADQDDENYGVMPGYCMYVHENTPAAIGFKECEHCHLLKPTIDTAHCDTCDRCVIGRDHHCPFLGTCVGERNRPHFVLMLFLMLVLAIACMSFVLARIIQVVIRIPRSNINPTEASFELGMAILFGVLIVLKFFIFPRYFSKNTNLKILYVISIYGLGMTIFSTSVGHVPTIPGLIWYSEVVISLFVATSLVDQIRTIKEGMSLTQMARIEQREEEAEELKRQLIKRQSTDSFGANIYRPRSWGEVISYIIRGFFPTAIPSVSLS